MIIKRYHTLQLGPVYPPEHAHISFSHDPKKQSVLVVQVAPPDGTGFIGCLSVLPMYRLG